MKIVQISASSKIGGGEQILFSLVKNLSDRYEFLVVAPPGLLLEKISNQGVDTKSLRSNSFLGIIIELRHFLKRENVGVVNVHGTRAAFWVRLAVIGLERPKIIYTLHGLHIAKKNPLVKWPLLWLEELLNYYTDTLVCVSEADRKVVLGYNLISSENLIVIKNGINIGRFQISPSSIKEAKQDLRISDKFILGSFARLHPQKDFNTLLMALKLVIPLVPDIEFLIVGDGPLRSTLEKKVKDLRIGKWIRFLGFREDVPILMNLCDIVILSTNWEALGLVCLEAGACRKPIIASDVEGPREAVVDRETGYLFRPGSEKDLAEKIVKLYKSKELRKKMGRKGFKFVSREFSLERMLEQYVDLYDRYL